MAFYLDRVRLVLVASELLYECRWIHVSSGRCPELSMNSQVFAMYEFFCRRIQVFRVGCVYSEYKGYSLGTLLVRIAHDGSF
jgi:hypothetical protein